ncbi:MAG: hypothetical protein Q7U04_06010 [Bacteriovorax sp.]|nr:hypothetical protein [Bacteriovorax sp.]
MRNLLFLVYITSSFALTGLVLANMQKAHASTIFVPDSDTALLFNLVTNTASQLNELEKLVSNAEKYTGLMEKYNQIARDQYFRAERINYIAQNYVELSKRDPKDLEGLNSAIRALKSETESLKAMISEYRSDEARNEVAENVIGEKIRSSNQELGFANNQVIRSGEVHSTNEAQKMMAQNTALSYKAQVEGNQMNAVIAEKLTEQNKLLNRELKDEAIKKDERDQYYQIPSIKRSGRNSL